MPALVPSQALLQYQSPPQAWQLTHTPAPFTYLPLPHVHVPALHEKPVHNPWHATETEYTPVLPVGELEHDAMVHAPELLLTGQRGVRLAHVPI